MSRFQQTDDTNSSNEQNLARSTNQIRIHTILVDNVIPLRFHGKRCLRKYEFCNLLPTCFLRIPTDLSLRSRRFAHSVTPWDAPTLMWKPPGYLSPTRECGLSGKDKEKRKEEERDLVATRRMHTVSWSIIIVCVVIFLVAFRGRISGVLPTKFRRNYGGVSSIRR